MTFAIRINKAWTALPYGEPLREPVQASYQTLELRSEDERNALGVFTIPEPDAPPQGKVEIARTLRPDGDRPAYDVTYGDAPEAAVPDRCTNSDWRVGLILWGRFDEVEAKVIAARDSGAVQGKIVWQRWEYANDIFRAELMEQRAGFGFSEDDVNESMRRGAAVGAPSALAA